MKTALGVDAKLVAGEGGVFNVTVDGKLVFSKAATHRFPNAGEISKLLSA